MVIEDSRPVHLHGGSQWQVELASDGLYLMCLWVDDSLSVWWIRRWIIFTFLGMEVIGDGYVFVRGSAHPPVVKNRGALRTVRVPSGPIIGGRPWAPRMHIAISPTVLEPRNYIIIRSVVLCDIVDYWCWGHLITLEESCLNCSQQWRVYLYRNGGILSWIIVDCFHNGRTFLLCGWYWDWWLWHEEAPICSHVINHGHILAEPGSEDSRTMVSHVWLR